MPQNFLCLIVTNSSSDSDRLSRALWPNKIDEAQSLSIIDLNYFSTVD